MKWNKNEVRNEYMFIASFINLHALQSNYLCNNTLKGTFNYALEDQRTKLCWNHLVIKKKEYNVNLNLNYLHISKFWLQNNRKRKGKTEKGNITSYNLYMKGIKWKHKHIHQQIPQHFLLQKAKIFTFMVIFREVNILHRTMKVKWGRKWC